MARTSKRPVPNAVAKLRILNSYIVVDGTLRYGPGHHFAKKRYGQEITGKGRRVWIDGVQYEKTSSAYFIVKGRWTRANVYLKDPALGYTKANMVAKSDATYAADKKHREYLKEAKGVKRVHVKSDRNPAQQHNQAPARPGQDHRNF